MTEEQQIIRRAIKDLRAIEAGRHVPKWRAFVVRELEVLEAVAVTKLPNYDHPSNQPLPERELTERRS